MISEKDSEKMEYNPVKNEDKSEQKWAESKDQIKTRGQNIFINMNKFRF